MSLLSLADELLQCIFEALHADDVESFTAINRSTYQLACSSILPKHRLRKRNYTRVLLGDEYESEESKPWQGHPLNLICEINANPRIAEYVKYLEFTAFEQEYWHNGRAGLRALTRQRIDNGDWLLRELEEMGVEPDFSDSIFDNTIGAHTQHTHDPIDTCTVFAYLLTIVPNVTEIKACFHNQEGWHKNALKIFAHLAAKQGVTAPAPVLLTRLDYVEAEHWDTEGCESPMVYWPFVAWTPFRRLQGNMMGSGGSDLPTELRSARPRVTKTCLCNSVVDAESIGLLIRNTPLRIFRYEHGGANISYDDFQPRRILRMLKRHVGSTLEELVLLAADDTDASSTRTLLDFRGLKVLKRLVIDIDMFFSAREVNLNESESGYDTTDEETADERNDFWTDVEKERWAERSRRRMPTAIDDGQDSDNNDDDDDNDEDEDDDNDDEPQTVFRKLLDMLPESIESLWLSSYSPDNSDYQEFQEILHDVQTTRLKKLKNLRKVDYSTYDLALKSSLFPE